MRYLIDTHVCLWATAAKEKLSPALKKILVEDSEAEIFVSQVSFFEIAIKLKTGKLVEFDTTLGQFIETVSASGFKILPMKDEHLTAHPSFYFFEEHRDPFDRYLIATADIEKMAIITKDEKFSLYKNKVEIVW